MSPVDAAVAIERTQEALRFLIEARTLWMAGMKNAAENRMEQARDALGAATEACAP